MRAAGQPAIVRPQCIRLSRTRAGNAPSHQGSGFETVSSLFAGGSCRAFLRGFRDRLRRVRRSKHAGRRKPGARTDTHTCASAASADAATAVAHTGTTASCAVAKPAASCAVATAGAASGRNCRCMPFNDWPHAAGRSRQDLSDAERCCRGRAIRRPHPDRVRRLPWRRRDLEREQPDDLRRRRPRAALCRRQARAGQGHVGDFESQLIDDDDHQRRVSRRQGA